MIGPEIERYEILILGSGEAGKYLAWTFARAGPERLFCSSFCPIEP